MVRQTPPGPLPKPIAGVQSKAVLTLEQRTGKTTQRERGIRRAMLNRVDEVNVYAGDILGFVIVSKKQARKLLKKHGSKVTVREVEEFGMMMIEPVAF